MNNSGEFTRRNGPVPDVENLVDSVGMGLIERPESEKRYRD